MRFSNNVSPCIILSSKSYLPIELSAWVIDCPRDSLLGILIMITFLLDKAISSFLFKTKDSGNDIYTKLSLAILSN